MLVAAAHLVMYKKDTRAAIGWLGVVTMNPLVGTPLYFMFGINRLHRRAQVLRSGSPSRPTRVDHGVCDIATLTDCLTPRATHLISLERLIGQLTGRPLLGGNKISQLVGGAEA